MMARGPVPIGLPDLASPCKTRPGARPGRATVQEAMCAGCPIIVNHVIPGQEEGNARYIMETKSGTVALTQFNAGYGIINYGPRFAGYLLAALPLLAMFLLGMRYFIRGLTAGALKA